jgi:prepilin-type N-terminal cleavage/methylation domain-containing protein
MNAADSSPSSRKGFTLTELLIASSLGLVVLASFFGGFTQHRRNFHLKNIEQELQQNLRTAMLFLQRDLRYSGSGLVMGARNLNAWFGLPSSVTDIPWIVDGGTGSDELIIVGISGEAVARLTERVWEGEHRLSLEITDPSVLPYYPLPGDVLVLAGVEAVMLDTAVSRTRVDVSRDPTTPGVGVHLIYPVGTEVFQLNVIRYWVDEVEGVPCLLRDDSRFTYESNADRVVADGVERFKLSRNGNLVQIELEGRSRRRVPGAPSPDGLLRYTLNSVNRIRNTTPGLSIQGWPSDMLIDTRGGNRPREGGEG